MGKVFLHLLLILHSPIRILHSNGAPGGTCTHTLPADNGLLFCSATGAINRNSKMKWWEVLVTLQFVSSDTYFVTLDLQSSGRITSLKMVAGTGVAPVEAEFMRLA